MNKFRLIQLLNKVELAVGETVMSKKVKDNINELILDVKNEAINFTGSSLELKEKEKEIENIEIKTLKDLKDAYPDGLTHMIQSENSVLKYFVDHELVKTKPLIT